jgi:hypothetical protein
MTVGALTSAFGAKPDMANAESNFRLSPEDRRLHDLRVSGGKHKRRAQVLYFN